MSSRLVLVLGDLFIPDRASVSEQVEARLCVMANLYLYRISQQRSDISGACAAT